MKNLHVHQTEKVSLDAAIVGHCIDADYGRLLVLTEDLKIYEIQSNRMSEAKQVDFNLERGKLPARIVADDVIIVEYIVESGSLLVALRSGQFFRIGVSTYSPQGGIIHEHNKVITSVKLSTDQDLIALADDDNEIFILSSDCSVIYTSNALLQNDSVHKPVGVGWGSKETQFFGLDGRPSKEKQREEKILLEDQEINNISKIESSDIFKHFRKRQERSTVIDWRGDGQYLATLTYIPENSKHYLKVWNRNLELQYMSEQLVTMERGLLSWIPNGQYVCCAQRRDDRVNEISMFEKNGMVHQRVNLPTFMPHLYIKDLSWSPDSKILALVVIQFKLTSDSQVTYSHMIMLYTMQNFHYYLKYSSYLSCKGDHYSLRWNPNNHAILYVSSTSGKCIEYNLTLTVDHCLDESTVAVVDSNKLLITPFKICNIPPPMSALTLELRGLITRLISSTNNLQELFVLTSEDELYHNTKSGDTSFQNLIACIDNDRIKRFIGNLGCSVPVPLKDGYLYQNLTPISSNSIIATRQIDTDCQIVLLEILDLRVNSRIVTSLKNRRVISVAQGSYPNIFLSCDDLSCYRLDITSSELDLKFQIKTANEKLGVKETQFVASHCVMFTLTLDYTLYVDQVIVSPICCTSFEISENFLIYTSTENVMNFIPLDRLTSDKPRDDVGAWTQPIENGGTLVLVSEDESKVILQMPRGNLEILHPRILVLSRLIKYLDNGDYLNAMQLARRYRVDLNFLCDYMLRNSSMQFYEKDLNVLANSVANHDSTLLNLFIADLNNEDTILDRYKSAMMYLPQKIKKQHFDDVGSVGSKVNMICSNIRLPSENRYLQPRLLCLLKQEPRKTDEALVLIHNLTDSKEREAALKFLLYFVHAEQLYLDAISTHNTDIALMVASVSSMDPKGYLALLNSFNSVEDVNRRNYMMDVHVKNYERAFDHLLASLYDSSDKESTRRQLIELVISKRIYKHALRVCLREYEGCCSSDKSNKLNLDALRMETWTKYGDYLLEKRYYLEAGIAYFQSRELESDRYDEEKVLDSVTKCFQLCGQWVRCVASIERLRLYPTKREEAMHKVINQIASQGDPMLALLVAQAKKSSSHTSQLMKSKKWHLAVFFATDDEKPRIEKRIGCMIESDLDELISDLQDDMESAKSQFMRLRKLILTPQRMEQYDIGEGFNADTLSTADGSEATSVTMSGSGQLRGKVARSGAPSLKTKASSLSSKSQSSKGKRIQLKVGSRYEDMALVIELQKFIDRQEEVQGSAKHLLADLSEFTPPLTSLSDTTETVTKLLRARYDLAEDIRNTLWPKTDLDDNNSAYSLYKRYGKLFATGDSLENNEVKLLLRPNLPNSLLLFEL